MDYASTLPAFPEDQKTATNRVMGCTAQVRAPRIKLQCIVTDHGAQGCAVGGREADKLGAKGHAIETCPFDCTAFCKGGTSGKLKEKMYADEGHRQLPLARCMLRQTHEMADAMKSAAMPHGTPRHGALQRGFAI